MTSLGEGATGDQKVQSGTSRFLPLLSTGSEAVRLAVTAVTAGLEQGEPAAVLVWPPGPDEPDDAATGDDAMGATTVAVQWSGTLLETPDESAEPHLARWHA